VSKRDDDDDKPLTNKDILVALAIANSRLVYGWEWRRGRLYRHHIWIDRHTGKLSHHEEYLVLT
jgi:hypothetical protein